MRKLLLAITICVVAVVWVTPVEAQSAGIKVGRIWSEFDGDTGDDTTFERRADWTAGLFARFAMGPLSLQLEGLYARRGTEVAGGIDPDAAFEMTYVEVPVLLRIGSGATAIYGGGYGALKVDAKATSGGGAELDISADVEDFDYGVVFGVGLGLGKFELDGRYTMGLAELLKDPSAPVVKHRAVTVSAGFRF